MKIDKLDEINHRVYEYKQKKDFYDLLRNDTPLIVRISGITENITINAKYIIPGIYKYLKEKEQILKKMGIEL